MVSNKNPFSLGSVGMCKELKAYFCVWQEKGFVQQIATAFEFWDLFPSFPSYPSKSNGLEQNYG